MVTIKEIISTQSNIPEHTLTDGSRFKEDLGMDSLDSIELIYALETVFDIEINDNEAAKLLTVGELTEYVKQYLQ